MNQPLTTLNQILRLTTPINGNNFTHCPPPFTNSRPISPLIPLIRPFTLTNQGVQAQKDRNFGDRSFYNNRPAPRGLLSTLRSNQNHSIRLNRSFRLTPTSLPQSPHQKNRPKGRLFRINYESRFIPGSSSGLRPGC